MRDNRYSVPPALVGQRCQHRTEMPVCLLDRCIQEWQRFAYSTNAGSGSVLASRVGTDGCLSLINGAAGMTGAGASAIDASISNDGRFLYVLNG